MRRGVAILAGFAMALAAAASRAAPLGDNLVKLAPSPFKLPQNIGPLRYTGENRYSDRRLGRSYSYAASGITLTIYVYDYGTLGIPDGPDSIFACKQFESAKSEIEHGDNYQNVVLRGEVSRPMKPAADAPLAREALYELDRNGIHALSLLWVTAADGFFVKLRLSLRAEVADELDEAREQVLEAVAGAISAPVKRIDAAARKPAAPSEPAAADAAGMELEAGIDPADTALWLAYAVELARYSHEHPEIRPACGGLLVPGFAAELAARRALLAALRARSGAGSSDYLALLARIDDAGLLDEYVWYYLRDARIDVTPPAGLDLAAFETFRERELSSHVPQSGAHIRINAIHVLPLASGP